jgi:hypothetical protein
LTSRKLACKQLLYCLHSLADRKSRNRIIVRGAGDLAADIVYLLLYNALSHVEATSPDRRGVVSGPSGLSGISPQLAILMHTILTLYRNLFIRMAMRCPTAPLPTSRGSLRSERAPLT